MGAGASVNDDAELFQAVKEEYEAKAADATTDEAQLELFRSLKAKFAPDPTSDIARRSKYLERTRLSSFESPLCGSVTCIQESASVADAADVLNDGNFMACPVKKDGAPDEGADWASAYVGMVDVVRLMQHVLVNMKEGEGLSEQPSYNAMFNSVPVTDIVASRQDVPFLPLSETDSLLDCCVLLGKYHVPRVPIVDAEGELVNIITRSSAVREINERMKETPEVFESLATKPLGELISEDSSFGNSDVITVCTTDPVSNVLRAIIQNDITGIGVVDQQGRLVGNFSARDVRQMANKQKWNMVSGSGDVGSFCRLCNCHLSGYDDEEGFIAPICCRDTDTYAQLAELVSSKRIHRVYMVDDEGKPVRVISLTDILKKLVQEPASFSETLSRYDSALGRSASLYDVKETE